MNLNKNNKNNINSTSSVKPTDEIYYNEETGKLVINQKKIEKHTGLKKNL